MPAKSETPKQPPAPEVEAQRPGGALSEAHLPDTGMALTPVSMAERIEAETQRMREVGPRREAIAQSYRSGRDLIELIRDDAAKAAGK